MKYLISLFFITALIFPSVALAVGEPLQSVMPDNEGQHCACSGGRCIDVPNISVAPDYCNDKCGESLANGGAPVSGSCPSQAVKPGEAASGITIDSIKAEARSLNKAKFSDPSTLIGIAISFLMAFIGSISLVLYIWAGFLWMTSAGNAERAGKGKTIIVWTTLGVVVMLSSYVLVNFVLGTLTGDSVQLF